MTATTTLQVTGTLGARVYCPICSHLVEAKAHQLSSHQYERIEVIKGQRCRRCSALLDAASILDVFEMREAPPVEIAERTPRAAVRSKRRKRIAA
jgi:uncharacterized Zn finger protein (UPF0148 family)